MALPISAVFTLAYNVSTDKAGTDVLTKGTFTVADSTSNLFEASGSRSVVPASNIELELNGVSASRLVLLFADAAFNVRFGSAIATPFAVAPMAAGQRAVFFGTLPSVASVWIENPNLTTSLSVKWAVAGI